MRAWPRSALLLLPLLLASDAGAADLGGGAIVFETQLPDEDNEGAFVEVTDEIRIREFFNRANCQCGTVFNVEMDLEGNQGPVESDEVEVWVGNNCTDIELQPIQCCSRQDTASFGACPDTITPFETQTIATMFVDREVTVQAWVDPLTGDCSAGGSGIEGTTSLWALIDDEKDGIYELSYNHPIEFDTQLPPAPINIELSSGEEALVASWDLPTGNEDIEYFQLLCARADGSVDDADNFPRFDEQYRIASNVCPDQGIPPDPVEASGSSAAAGPMIDGGMIDGGGIDADVPDAAVPDAGIDPPATGIATLDPDFVCGDGQATSTSIRVEGLENGVEYEVVLAVIDPALNARFINLGAVTPAAVTDFWEDYKSEGGGAEGGFCFVATASYGNYDHPFVRVLRDFRDGTLAKFGLGRAFIDWYYENSPALAGFIARHPVARAASAIVLFPLVVAAGIWEYTGLFGKLVLVVGIALLFRARRRRRKHRAESESEAPRRSRKLAVAVGAGALALLSMTALASAQTPWWDETEQDDIADEEGVGKAWWNFELKFGPYFPDVDAEFSMDVGPFERMYGDGPFLMTQIELERFFLQPHGQLGVGVSLGFLGTSANAFTLDADGNTNFNDRSEGDKTKFRLLPTSVHAVYRWTDLDSQFGIPLVPFGKLGLSYYLWYATAPSGEIAEVDGDKARGGTLGWQGSVGLALRAERLDPDAEVSLRTELGISHAGIFAELLYAQVDGFGSDTKLSVGDLTWFGGINFEF